MFSSHLIPIQHGGWAIQNIQLMQDNEYCCKRIISIQNKIIIKPIVDKLRRNNDTEKIYFIIGLIQSLPYNRVNFA